MSLQYKPQHYHGGPWYSPNRDIVRLFPNLLRCAAAGLAEDKLNKEPWLGEFAKKHQISEEVLGQTMVRFANFMQEANSHKCSSPADALSNSGFFDMPHEAQLLVSAKIGQMVVGTYWYGLREVINPNDSIDFDDMELLSQSVSKLSATMMNKAK